MVVENPYIKTHIQGVSGAGLLPPHPLRRLWGTSSWCEGVLNTGGPRPAPIQCVRNVHSHRPGPASEVQGAASLPPRVLSCLHVWGKNFCGARGKQEHTLWCEHTYQVRSERRPRKAPPAVVRAVVIDGDSEPTSGLGFPLLWGNIQLGRTRFEE